MKKIKTLFSIFVFAIIASLTLNVYAADITIKVNEQTSPVSGATIYLINNTGLVKDSGQTDSTGTYTFTGKSNGDYGVFAYKTGSYGIVPLSSTLSVTGNVTKTILLVHNSSYPRSSFGKPFSSYTDPSISSNQNFSWRRNNNTLEYHDGMDIGGKSIGTQINSIHTGTVVDRNYSQARQAKSIYSGGRMMESKTSGLRVALKRLRFLLGLPILINLERSALETRLCRTVCVNSTDRFFQPNTY